MESDLFYVTVISVLNSCWIMSNEINQIIAVDARVQLVIDHPIEDNVEQNRQIDWIEMSLCDSMQAVFDRVEERATHNCYGRRDTYALSVDGVDVAGDDMDDGVIGALKLGDFLHSRGVDWWIINFDSHRLRMQ